jgi:hypothetical protein
MFGSVCGTQALLGDEAQVAEGAAPCEVIKPRGK